MSEQIVKQFAEAVKAEGGLALLVGGYVRDELMGIPSKDIDIECYAIQPDKLEEVCSRFGKVSNVGKKFQVFKLGNDIDVSLPRLDIKTGVGHKGFETIFNPNLDVTTAASRRDFTINAIMKDPLTGVYHDPFNGRGDIEAKTLKVVSKESFQEDSLRVLRLVQFASRFQFAIDADTFVLASKTNLSDLPKERIWMELEKMFLKSPKPSVGVNLIMSLGIRDKLFPHLCVGKFQEDALDVIPKFSGVSNEEKLVIGVALMCWGSPATIDELGVTSVEGYNVKKRVEELLEFIPYKLPESDYEFHKLSQKLNMHLFGLVLCAYNSPYYEGFYETIQRLGIEHEPVESILKGRHLIEMGMQPSTEFGKILEEAYDRQLRGEIATIDDAKQFAKLWGSLDSNRESFNN